MTKQIPLTQGQVALVDDWHYEELSQFKWYAIWNQHTKTYYAQRSDGNKAVRMHREIMKTPKGMICDHRNHNTLDNQEHNLRNVTNSQNRMNGRVRSDNQLGLTCISPRKSGFRVQVVKDGQRVFDKSFRTLDEAICARDRAHKQFKGEYAYEANL